MTLDEIVAAIGVEPFDYDPEHGVLYCADCLDILPKIPDKSVDLVLTDPPYGLRDIMRGGGWAKKMKYIRDGATWDSKPVDDRLLALAISKANQTIIWGGNYFTLPPKRGWLVWQKRGNGFSMAEAELAWTNIDIPIRLKTHYVIDPAPVHPTQKPVEVIRWCLTFTPDAQIILDPFAGSGTTLVAAKQLGRKYIGIEISKEYCKICVDRLRQRELF